MRKSHEYNLLINNFYKKKIKIMNELELVEIAIRTRI